MHVVRVMASDARERTERVQDESSHTGKDEDGLVRGAYWKNNKKEFLFGNYEAYYGYRHDKEAQSDGRLDAVVKKFGSGVFEDRTILDIGCNSGFITLSLADAHNAKHVTGIDIDVNLVGKALKQLRWAKQRSQDDDEWVPLCTKSSSSGVTGVLFPHNVEFMAEDMIETDILHRKNKKFDVVLCLSVTKWVHFNYGDAGIKKLFQQIKSSLNPNGLLILEPQEFSTYRKKRHLTPIIREHVRSIELKPEHFEEYLISQGFSLVERLDPDAKSKGFERPVFIYKLKKRQREEQEVEVVSSRPRIASGIDVKESPDVQDFQSGCTPQSKEEVEDGMLPRIESKIGDTETA